MGTYRNLMIYFCCCSIFFSIFDALVQPNIQTYKSAFFMVLDVKSRRWSPWIGTLLIDFLCGFIAVTVYGIAIHFIYRFFALERKGRVKYFNGKYLIIWFSIPFFAGTIWFFVTDQVFPMNKMNTEYIRSTVKQFFNLEMEDCVFGAAVFYPISETGERITNWRAFFGLGCYLTLLTIPFLTILVLGAKSWRIVEKLTDSGESEFTKNLQLQLCKALIAQTAIPVFLFFIPFGFIFILPMFEIPCQFMSAPITLVFAFYPVLDPLPILIFVDYYRNAVFEYLNMLKCKPVRVEDDTSGRVPQSANVN